MGGELHQGGTSCLAPCPTLGKAMLLPHTPVVFPKWQRRGSHPVAQPENKHVANTTYIIESPGRGAERGKFVSRAWRWGPVFLGPTIHRHLTRLGDVARVETFADCQCTLRAWRWGPRGLGATVHSHNNARDQSETHNRRSDNCKRAPITNIERALSCGAWEVDFAR